MDRFAALQAFVCVAEEGSFTAAAERLDLSKSVVSKQIKALEQHLGVRLFNRTTRRLHLTEPGLAVPRTRRAYPRGVAGGGTGGRRPPGAPPGLLRVNVPVSVRAAAPFPGPARLPGTLPGAVGGRHPE
ncbi:MAG: LysR family transcriptional regulator [Arhodomonas sp.]|nr:LysR family transcriptional regulator [Arhodomonas sp.]